MMWTAVTVVLCCCLLEIAVAGKCGYSGPEITLSEIASACNHEDKGRIPECVAAMHRYCHKVTYPKALKGIAHFGASQEAANGRIAVGCGRSISSHDVKIGTLQSYNPGCSMEKSQHRDCLSAIHQYCKAKHGSNAAGISQEVGNGVLQVHCFESPRIENVLDEVLRHQHPGCSHKKSDSADCFAAASRWCQELSYSGGITQESDSTGITVACYDADFVNIVFVKRTNDYFNAERHTVKVCSRSIAFDVVQGYVLMVPPDFIKTEVYDNTNSSAVLRQKFIVSTDIIDRNIFTHTHSVEIGAEVTFSARTPIFSTVKKEIKLSMSVTNGLSFTKENTKTIHYSDESTVEVPPGQSLKKEAVVTKSALSVPWSGKVLSELGTEKDISGIWYGVSTFGVEVVQTNLTKSLLDLVHQYTTIPYEYTGESCPPCPCSDNLALCPDNSALCPSDAIECSSDLATSPENSPCTWGQMPSSG